MATHEKSFLKNLTENLEEVGSISVFAGKCFYNLFRPPWRFNLFLEQLDRIGVQSIPIITLSSLSIGMIFSLQITGLLAMFRAESMVGAGIGLTLARELSPVITSLMLIARNGSAMTAELGTMRVTEQIDALETMSVDPIKYLVVPRMTASIVAFPLLTALSNVVGVIGSFFVATTTKNVDPGSFLEQLYSMVDPPDIISGVGKAMIMGIMVSIICSYYGFYSEGGSKGVGISATKAVVISSVGILIADYIMADILMKIGL